MYNRVNILSKVSSRLKIYSFFALLIVTLSQIASPDLNFLFAYTFSSLVPDFISAVIRSGIYFTDRIKRFPILPPLDIKRTLSFSLMLGGIFIALLNCSRAFLLCRDCNLFKHKSEITFINII